MLLLPEAHTSLPEALGKHPGTAGIYITDDVSINDYYYVVFIGSWSRHC